MKCNYMKYTKSVVFINCHCYHCLFVSMPADIKHNYTKHNDSFNEVDNFCGVYISSAIVTIVFISADIKYKCNDIFNRPITPSHEFIRNHTISMNK